MQWTSDSPQLRFVRFSTAGAAADRATRRRSSFRESKQVKRKQLQSRRQVSRRKGEKCRARRMASCSNSKSRGVELQNRGSKRQAAASRGPSCREEIELEEEKAELGRARAELLSRGAVAGRAVISAEMGSKKAGQRRPKGAEQQQQPKRV